MRGTSRGWMLAVAFALAVAGWGRVALASHYDLVDIDLVTKAEREALAKAGIESTDVLLQRAATPAKRAALAAATKLPVARLDELARMCDLLQVRGIGPSMVKLLTAAGVKTLQDLMAHDPAKLAKELQDLNDRRHIAGLVPPAEMLRSWIEQARTLPHVYKP